MTTLRRLVLALTLVAAAPAAFAGVEEAVTAEIARLDAVVARLEAKPIAPPFHDVLPTYKTALERVRNTKATELRIYRLRDPFIGIEAMAFLVDHDTTNIADVEKLWNANRARFERKPDAPAGNELQIAIQQAAINRAQVYFKASLPYGKADGPRSGLYYMGEAEGHFAYAKFVGSLPFDKSEKAKRPSAGALAAAIDKLDAESIAVFKKAPTERTAIPSSALLKEARELLRRGWLEATTFTLLEARFDLTRRQSEKDTAFKAGDAVARDSLEALWLAVTKESDRGDAAFAGVLPLYRAMLSDTAATKRAALPKKALTVTLIRWPYT